MPRAAVMLAGARSRERPAVIKVHIEEDRPMRGLSYVLLVVGIIVVVVGLLNHFALHKNPVAHTSTIAVAIGAVLAVIGVVMMLMGGRSATA